MCYFFIYYIFNCLVIVIYRKDNIIKSCERNCEKKKMISIQLIKKNNENLNN